MASEKINFAPPLLKPPQTRPKPADLLVVPGEFGQPALAYNPLRTSQAIVEFPDNQPLGKVTVVNNLNAPISDAAVMWVARNRNGTIVGSGYASTGRVDGTSSKIIEVPVCILPPYDGLIISASVLLPDGVKIGE